MFAGGIGLAAGVALSARPAAASSSSSEAHRNVVKCGADPTGRTDSSRAFASAFRQLPNTGGTIFVPGGLYLLDSPLVFANKPLCLLGDGSAASVLVMNHTGTAIIFVGLTQVYPAATPFQLCGITIAGPPSGAAAAGAVSVAYPPSVNETGYQYCSIEDLNIGAADVNSANGCNIALGLSLRNIWKSRFSNVRMFGPFQSGTFIELGGVNNVDNWFLDCIADGPRYGFVIASYSQGVRITRPLLITGVGFTCNFQNTSGTNILGLYIEGGEFNTSVLAADLQQVSQGYISDTHFRCINANAPAVVSLENCVGVRMNNLIVEGPYPSGGGSGNVFGINLGGALCQVAGCLFTNLANGVQFMPGALSNSAIGLQLVNEAAYPQLVSIPAAVDNSGNVGAGVNNAQWQVNNGQFQTLY